MSCLLYAKGLGWPERWKGEYTASLILNLGPKVEVNGQLHTQTALRPTKNAVTD
jgi:hypothetical protein